SRRRIWRSMPPNTSDVIASKSSAPPNRRSTRPERLWGATRARTGVRAAAGVIGAGLLTVIDLFRRRHILPGDSAAVATVFGQAITGRITNHRRIGLLHVALRRSIEIAFLAGAVDAAFLGVVVGGAAGSEQAEHADAGEEFIGHDS